MPARLCAALAFAAGLIMTLAVAWACALWSPVDDPLPKNPVDVAAIINADVARTQSDVMRAGFGFAEFGSTTFVSLDLETGQSWQMQSPVPVLVESRAGWPCLCLTRFEASGDSQANSLDQGVAIKQGTHGAINGRRMPLRPLWTGLAINTVFFSAILLLLKWTTVQALSRWRHSRGRCRSCGYPVGDFARCPECGQSTT